VDTRHRASTQADQNVVLVGAVQVPSAEHAVDWVREGDLFWGRKPERAGAADPAAAGARNRGWALDLYPFRTAAAMREENHNLRAVVFMLLLALQIGVQPMLVKECIDKERVILLSVVVGQELMKVVLSFCMMQLEHRGNAWAQLQQVKPNG
jgi:hypothetical protein